MKKRNIQKTPVMVALVILKLSPKKRLMLHVCVISAVFYLLILSFYGRTSGNIEITSLIRNIRAE